MPLIQVVVTLIVVGVLLWLVETQLPIAQPIKLVIRVVVILVVILWLLQIFNIVGPTIRLNP